MEKHENIHRGFWEMIRNNFIGGIAWGLGATVGVSIILALLIMVLNRADFSIIPIVGSFVSDVTEIVLDNLRR